MKITIPCLARVIRYSCSLILGSTLLDVRWSNSACQVFWLAMVDLGGYHPGGVWQSGYIYKGGGRFLE